MMFQKNFTYDAFLEGVDELEKEGFDELTEKQQGKIYQYMRKNHLDFDSCFFFRNWKEIYNYVEWATIDPF